MKKKWTKPELTILVRGKLEEAVVLYICKYTSMPVAASDAIYDQCTNNPACGWCSDSVHS